MRPRSASSTSAGGLLKTSPGVCAHRPDNSRKAREALDIGAHLIVQWHAVHPELGWTLLGLLACSIPLWRLAPGERRRIRFVWALSVVALALWLVGGVPAAPRWVAEADLALVEIIALHLAAVVIFRVVLKRLETPRILVELLIGAGYAAIVVGLLTRVGVNLTGLVATSAVVTAIIGFGLQDVLGNLAGGLVMEVEQAISEGDWIRTDQYFGQVRSVRVRHTSLETPDGDTILVPNSAITRSPITVLGRTVATAGGPVKHRRLVTFQLPYSHGTSSVIAAVDQALTASPIEGIAEDPRPRCVIVDFHPLYVQYGALVWLMRPGMEYVDVSRVRTRITFALTRMGAPLAPISHVLDMRSSGDPQESMDAETADRLAALRGVEILQCLNEEEARRLAPLMKRTSF